MAKNRIFELNGKAYDALTGELLGDARHLQYETPVRYVIPQAAPLQQGIAIQSGGKPANASQRPHKASDIKHVTAHQPQPAKTLMRRAVQQPTKQLQPVRPSATVHTHSNALHASRMSPAAIKPKISSDIIDPIRVQRANDALRSQSVQHFRSTAAAPTNPYAALKLQPHQQLQARTQQIAQQSQTPTTSEIKLIHPPVAPQFRGRPVQAQQQPVPQPQRQAIAPAAPQPARQRPLMDVGRPIASARRQAAPAPIQHNEAVSFEQDIFDQALANATSHEEPAPKESAVSKIKHKGKKRKRTLGIVASLAVFLALFGFIAIQNRENIQLQLASAKAGFSAASPLYKPDGYSLSKMTYATGSVASLYKNTGNQSFTLTQKKSNWDSQTLLENFVATKGESYKGFQSNGRTVYVFGEGEATWVNGGVWYQIQGADELTNEQLVKIAASM